MFTPHEVKQLHWGIESQEKQEDENQKLMRKLIRQNAEPKNYRCLINPDLKPRQY